MTMSMSASVKEGAGILQSLSSFAELPPVWAFEPEGAGAVDLAALWDDLGSGRCEVEDDFCAGDRCYFILRPANPTEATGQARARNFQILQRVLLEGGQKRVASEFGLSTSTIAAISKQCLNLMGLSPPCSRVSPLLVMAAYAWWHGAAADRHRASVAPQEGTRFRVLSALRPDVHVAGLLTPAESSVIRLLVEGRSHNDIALARRTSVRTVANQLASAFRRLGVSGRADLLVRLVECPESANCGHRGPVRKEPHWPSFAPRSPPLDVSANRLVYVGQSFSPSCAGEPLRNRAQAFPIRYAAARR
jgi:DNA-binding CsgD family transcriptional regulator